MYTEVVINMIHQTSHDFLANDLVVSVSFPSHVPPIDPEYTTLMG
jgi:hypothetical protein